LTAFLQPLARVSSVKVADNGAWSAQKLAFVTVQRLVAMWRLVVKHQSAQLPVVTRALLPLLQQLQRCGPLLQPAPGEKAAAVKADGVSSSTVSSIWEMPLAAVYYETQRSIAMVLYNSCRPQDLPPDSAAAVSELLLHPSAAHLLLQVLAACTAHLHAGQTVHNKQQQKQQGRLRQKHSTAGSSNSSSSTVLPVTGSASESGNKHNRRQQQRRQLCRHQPHEADLLPIPAFHQDLFPLLPCGDAYLSGAAQISRFMDTKGCGFYECCDTAWWCAQALRSILTPRRRQQAVDAAGVWQPPPATPAADVPVQSPAAIQLSLQLQRVAASLVQRQRQEPQQQHAEEQPQKQQQQGRGTGLIHKIGWDRLLASSNALLQLQIRAVLQSGSSGLPQGLLQKAGLQLLLALSAPAQQQQQQIGSSSSSSSSTTGTQPRQPGENIAGQAMYVLRAAACGLAQTSSKQRLQAVTTTIGISMPC
jgi:hypothetical protein